MYKQGKDFKNQKQVQMNMEKQLEQIVQYEHEITFSKARKILNQQVHIQEDINTKQDVFNEPKCNDIYDIIEQITYGNMEKYVIKKQVEYSLLQLKKQNKKNQNKYKYLEILSNIIKIKLKIFNPKLNKYFIYGQQYYDQFELLQFDHQYQIINHYQVKNPQNQTNEQFKNNLEKQLDQLNQKEKQNEIQSESQNTSFQFDENNDLCKLSSNSLTPNSSQEINQTQWSFNDKQYRQNIQEEQNIKQQFQLSKNQINQYGCLLFDKNQNYETSKNLEQQNIKLKYPNNEYQNNKELKESNQSNQQLKIFEPQLDKNIDCQQQLLDVIGRINRNSQDIEKGLDGQTDIILLVGNTGSGKSTVFNLLCEAEFEMIKEGHRDILQIKQGTENYSEMKHGTESITTQPIYHYIPEINHLLVDFPGFHDTRGEIEELVIQLLFNKIVTKNQVKIVYLIQHPLQDLPNRGTFVQEFLKLFQDQKFKFSESGLFLNQFTLEEVSESNLIANAKEQLFQITKDPQQKYQNIYVMRNINKKRLLEIPQIREKILQEIVTQQPIKFQPYQIQRVEIISEYLQKTSKVLTDAIFNCFDQEIKNLVLKSPADVLIKVQVILRNFQPQKLSVVKQYQQLFQVYEELTLFLQSKRNVETSQNISFFKIYQFFYEFSQYIDGYMQCADNIRNIYDFMCLLEIQISQKLTLMNLEKGHIKKLKEQQAEFQQWYLQQQEIMNKEMKKVLQQEKYYSDKQIQILQKKLDQQFLMLQNQLEESQKSKGGFFGSIFKYVLPIAFIALVKIPLPFP